MDADGFTIVLRGKGRRRASDKGQRSAAKPQDESSSSSVRVETWLKRHERFKRQIRLTRLFEVLLAEATAFQPQAVVCYGIGMLSITRSALQLALISSVCDALTPTCSLRLSFDPMHGLQDKALLTSCGFTALEGSVLGKDAPGEARVLFFMPHSERWMYCDVGRAREHALANTLVIGNSFKEYVKLDASAKIKDLIWDLVHESRVEETMLSLEVNADKCTLDAGLVFDSFNNTRIIKVIPS